VRENVIEGSAIFTNADDHFLIGLTVLLRPIAFPSALSLGISSGTIASIDKWASTVLAHHRWCLRGFALFLVALYI